MKSQPSFARSHTGYSKTDQPVGLHRGNKNINFSEVSIPDNTLPFHNEICFQLHC